MMYDLVDKVFTVLLSLDDEDERQFAETRKNINHIHHILHDMVISILKAPRSLRMFQ